MSHSILTKLQSPKPKTELTPAYLSGIVNTDSADSAHHTNFISQPTTQKDVPTNKTPTFTRVDVTIAGTPHKITCPDDEVENVQSTANRLHENLIQLRQQVKGKSPNNEELLVLHCLELYDQLAELKARQKFASDNTQRAEAMLDNLLKNAKTLLR